MHRAALAATVASATLAAALAATPPVEAAPAPGKTRAILIVANHPDDEMTTSAWWTHRPGELKVFLWLDATLLGKSKAINPTTGRPVRHDPGEYNPLDYPGGLDTGYFRGSLMNLNAMRKADPSIPRLLHDTPTKTFTDNGRHVTTWTNPGRGAAISYGHPTGRHVTPTSTRNAINDVTRNPGKYGLPTGLTWTDLVGAGYYNRSGTGAPHCDLYANPYHGAANTGVSLYAYPQFTGRKAYPICKADPATGKTRRVVSADVARVAYSPDGSIPRYFGWLYAGKLTTDTTRSGVFSREQWFATGPARTGR